MTQPGTKVLLVADQAQCGSPSAATLAAASLAATLANALDGTWSALEFCPDAARDGSSLGRTGCKEVYECKVASDQAMLSEYLAPTVCRVVSEHEFGYVVGPSTTFGRDLMPRVAGCLGAGYVGDCTGLRARDAEVTFLRATHAARVTAECRVSSPVAVVTAQSAAFDKLSLSHATCPSSVIPFVAPNVSAARVEVIELACAATKRPALGEAQVVVSGGRPLGKDFFDVLAPLADRFEAALGATRALCDMGHAPSHFQVGQTGAVVAPGLYFAIGLSGSVQHVAGMSRSKLVVAINSDPDAPIFAFADLGMVGDLFRLVPAITAAVANARSR